MRRLQLREGCLLIFLEGGVVYIGPRESIYCMRNGVMIANDELGFCALSDWSTILFTIVQEAVNETYKRV
jgi:hypothetical protein